MLIGVPGLGKTTLFKLACVALDVGEVKLEIGLSYSTT